MKSNQSKLIVFISVLILFFLLFLYFSFRSYDYKKTYKVNKYTINESYNKEKKIYTFIIKSDKEEYAYQIRNKYLRKKELVNNIEIAVNENETCVLPESDKLDFYPLCSNNKEVYSYNLSNKNLEYKYKKIDKSKETYNKIDINYLNDNSYLIYNYNGFYLINNKKNKNINLFESDVYSINLIYQQDEYLILPNYNQNYYFDKLFLINILTGKVEEIELEQEISFESIFLGTYKNNIYLLDKKEEKEYKINLNNKKVEETEFYILKNEKLEKTTFKKIVNNNLLFDNKENNNYKIIDNFLYQTIGNTNIKISNKSITRIIKETSDTIYYLSEEKLYMFNNIYGEVLLLSNFEWNFNNTNMIFFYK